ncbi:MAG: YadA-like family protein, partial [Pseudoxanthomonas suwonensis]|nr:YadA-like family protein [Pseudoxanthomonas suwonensis]
NRSVASGTGSTAIGYQSVAERNYTVSVGKAGAERQIIHVKAGTAPTDAVNVAQLNAAMSSMGAAGAFGQSFSIAGVEYGTVGEALAAINTRMGWAAGGTQVVGMATGAPQPVDADAQAQALASAQAYADRTATQAVTTANSYTDARFTAWEDTFAQYQDTLDARFRQTDRRIDEVGAMGGAMSAAAMNTAGLQGNNRIGVGVGSQGGRQALAVGYQRMVSNRASVSLSGAFTGNERSVSVGAGFSW